MRNLNLKLKNLYFKYSATDIFAINGINLEVNSGEKLAVLGENGMGKSTLFFLTNGVYEPTEGEIFLNDKKLTRSKKDLIELRKSVGLVFQDPETQFIAPTVEEEISFGPINLGMSPSHVQNVVDEVIEILDMERLRNKSLYTLSGGEKKLVSIASVLTMGPDIIIFDEPISGLDYSNIQTFKNVLEILYNKGIGLVISVHDINFAWEWADRVVILSDGKIIADGNAREILSNEEILKKASLEKPDLVKFYDL
ncbi:MAG: ABC transporter ATP-binding protein, partial [Tissierellia bacterium]|nr:ABC transporter ATP-binding protein [Tissierellia bacterium]